MNRDRSSPRAALPSREHGATMLEFAFVLPVLVLMFFAIVDFSRYYAVCAVLRAGASDGLNRARKIPNFDLNWNNLPSSSLEYDRYVKSRRIILDETERTPFETILSAQASPSDAVLMDITTTDNGLSGGSGAPTMVRSSAVLRPGDCVDVAGHGTICNGPTGSTLSPGQLMEKHPIRVIMFAEVRPFLPFIGTLLAKGEAYGYREVIPAAPLPGQAIVAGDVGDTLPGGPLPPVLPGAGVMPPPVAYALCLGPAVATAVNASRTLAGDPVCTPDTPTCSPPYNLGQNECSQFEGMP